MTVEIRPGTSDLFPDVAVVVGPAKPTAHACWCLSYRLPPGDFNGLDEASKPGVLKDLCERDVSPGLIAYVDGEPAGWCGFGARVEIARFRSSKTILPVDDLPVWSVICFIVLPQFRGQGLARQLLQATAEYARANGVPALEGYPVDPGSKRLSAAASFVGTTELFESVGFVRIRESAGKSGGLVRWIVRLDL